MNKIKILLTFLVLATIAILLLITTSKKDNKIPLDFINQAAVVMECDPITEVENKPFYYFQHGWIRQQSGFKMILPKGIIRFFALTKQDCYVNLLISTGATLLELPTIKLLVNLNGSFVRELVIFPEEKEIEILLKKQLVRKGSNYLELSLAGKYDLKRDPDKKFYATEYLNVKRIQLKNYLKTANFDFTAGKRQDRIIQPAQSWFELYFKPTGNEVLHYSFIKKKGIRKNRTPTALTVKIEQEGQPRKIITKFPLSSSIASGKGTISFQPFKGKNVKLIFEYISGEPDSIIEWQDLYLSSSNEAKIQKTVEKTLNSKPHIFLILIDAARYDYFGFAGFKNDTSPNIDKIAQHSFNFHNFYAQAPYTRASVATMLSGLYSETHTVRDKHDLFPEKVYSLPQYLKQKGYFNHTLTGSIVLIKNNLIKNFDSTVYVRKRKKIANSSEMQLEKLKSSLLQADFSNPQFFYIHLLPPHEPYNPPAPFKERFITTKRYKQINNMKIVNQINVCLNPNNNFVNFLDLAYQNNLFYADYLVGEITKLLKEKKIFQDSIVIITSDHGEAFFEHKKIGHNNTNYNDMIKIPFLFKMPGQQKKVDVDHNFGLIDLAPTLLELMGLKQKDKMQGTSFSPLLLGQAPGENCNFLYSRATSEKHNISLVYREYKYINYFGREELYNIKEDPHEKINLFEIEVFMAGFLRQKAFEQMSQNIKMRTKYKIIRKKDKNKKRFNKELKTLGYL